MAIIRKCDRCGNDVQKPYKYKAEAGEFVVNSFRIGNWDNKRKQWRSIASGYDLCATCAEEITTFILGTEETRIKMRKVEHAPKSGGNGYSWNLKVEAATESATENNKEDDHK